MNKEEIEKELKTIYEKRYGTGAVLRIQYNGKAINTPYHHWQLWYKDDNGVVHCNHDIYAYEDDKGDLHWYNMKPTPPPKPTPTTTFRDKLNNAIKNAISSGKIEYAEILSINENIQKARVFIKDSTTEGLYIVSLDKNENIVKTPTKWLQP